MNFCRVTCKERSENSTHKRGDININTISVVIPTYEREIILLNTVNHLLQLNPRPAEILIIDQTKKHTDVIIENLKILEQANHIRWIRLPQPSITHAMNMGLLKASHDIVLFLDDDIIPDKRLIAAHINAHRRKGCHIIAGQVLQLGETPAIDASFRFSSERRQFIGKIMGGNFSVKRHLAMKLGGFDENFVQVAYRFEADFAQRAIAAGNKILFEPEASIRHLKVKHGGTRFYGEHLTTIHPAHSVGSYYYLLKTRQVRNRLIKILIHPLMAIKTKFHMYRPWWIPITLISEIRGLIWAVRLNLKGPKYIGIKLE
jgi:GT2 family glycosyltransferase